MASRSTRCVGWGRRRPQGQRSRAGKCAAEEAGCRSRLRQGDPARGVEADFLSPSRHREAIEQVRRVLPVSEQQTCRVLVQHRSTQRHRPKDDADEQRLTADIIALVKDYGRYGYRRIHALLGHAGWQVSLSVVERIWRREGLKVPKRQPKRRRLWLGDGSCIRLRPQHRGHVWSYDFVEDQTRNGRKFRMLNIIDEFSRECLATVPVERRDRRAGRSVSSSMGRPSISGPTTAPSCEVRFHAAVGPIVTHDLDSYPGKAEAPLLVVNPHGGAFPHIRIVRHRSQRIVPVRIISAENQVIHQHILCSSMRYERQYLSCSTPSLIITQARLEISGCQELFARFDRLPPLVNVNGAAIALGHTLGMSCACLVATLGPSA